jgi:hypothetical protein
MQGLTENTLRVFKEMSMFPFIQEYTLIGDTALALQIHHRKSEEIDHKDIEAYMKLVIMKEFGFIS